PATDHRPADAPRQGIAPGYVGVARGTVDGIAWLPSMAAARCNPALPRGTRFHLGRTAAQPAPRADGLPGPVSGSARGKWWRVQRRVCHLSRIARPMDDLAGIGRARGVAGPRRSLSQALAAPVGGSPVLLLWPRHGERPGAT